MSIASFEWYVLGLWYFYECLLWQALSVGTNWFGHVTLTFILKTLWYVLGLWYFYECLLWQALSVGTNWFGHVTLTFILKTCYMFWMVCIRIWHFSWMFVDLSVGTNKSELLTFVFDQSTESIDIGYIFWMVCTRSVIFHISFPWDKTFPWVPTNLTLWPWPWSLTYTLKLT
jgi:hypothetical protein